MKPKKFTALAPILWTIFIFVTSSGVVTVRQLSTAVSNTSGPVQLSQSSFETFWRAVWWIFVKGWHATEFAILAWLVWKAFGRSAERLKSAALIAGAYALFDELHQVYIAGRGGRMSDVLIDWIGIGLFAVLVGTTWPKQRRIAAFLIATVAVFLLSVFPTPTFPLPGAPESHRFNP